MAPSPVPFRDDTPLPHELSKEEIKKVARDFAQAAVRAKEAGFKVVEVHAAHGYLLNQFLSPISNKRQDEYGGSFENRMRLTLEVIDAVKKEWPERNPLFVRISAIVWVDNAWSIDASVKLAVTL